MKKLLTVLLGVLLTSSTYTQTLSPTVISSSGGFSQNSNGSLSYTVAEMTMVQTFTANGVTLTQGFQQPNELVTGLFDIVHDEFGTLVLYPNPSVDYLWFGFQYPESGKVEVAVFDMLGQKVSELYNDVYTTGRYTQQINVSVLPAASYLLTANFTNSAGKIYTISKRFEVIN